MRDEKVAGPVVDAHCHVFNAADLPVRGFVRRVTLGDYERQVVLGPEALPPPIPGLAALLIRMVAGIAPTAEAELATIERGIPLASPEPESGALGDTPLANRILLERALREIVSQPLRSEPALSSTQREALLQAISIETGIEVGGPESGDWMPAVAGRLLAGEGLIARHVRWAGWLVQDRRTIVRRLTSLYGGANRVRLFTPAIVDFAAWLDEEPASPMEDQIRVMERIQRLASDAAVHCLAPFDPWRQILDEEAGRRPGALDLAQSAVRDMGFVGVKLYPPMGFRPIENAKVDQGYPARAVAISSFPQRLDAALEQLYSWAETEDVPLLAHAAESNGAANGYATRAHPNNWAHVLRQWPKLRLSLAHAGRFVGAGPDDPLAGTWEAAIGRLIDSGDGAVFADTSYLSEVLRLDLSSDEHDRIAVAFRAFATNHDPSFEHLLYGSDWLMLGREANHEHYLERFAALVRGVAVNSGGEHRCLASNAMRFLGLRRGEAGRARIDVYRRQHQLDDRWFRELDDVLVRSD